MTKLNLGRPETITKPAKIKNNFTSQFLSSSVVPFKVSTFSHCKSLSNSESMIKKILSAKFDWASKFAHAQKLQKGKFSKLQNVLWEER